MEQRSEQITKLLVKWERSVGHSIDCFWLLPVPLMGWISTESLHGSLHLCCSCKESCRSSDILRSLDETKFCSSLERGREMKEMLLPHHACARESRLSLNHPCTFVNSEVYVHCFLILWLYIAGKYQNITIKADTPTVHTAKFQRFPPTSLTLFAALARK